MRKKFVFVIMILLAAVVLSGCTGPVAWPGLGADEQTAYLANGQFVYALNASDGKERWHYPLQADSKLTFYSTPVVTPEGLVIIGSSGINHSLIAINPQKFPDTLPAPVSGFQRFFCNIGLAVCPKPVEVEEWIFTEAKDHWVAGPLALAGKLFAPNADGNLYVLDLNDGKLLEKVTLDGESNRPNRLWAQPTTDGQRIFVTSLDHSVYAIDVETYKIIWHENLGGAIPGGVVLAADGMLYAGSLSKQLERFDPATGSHEPVLDTKGWIWGTPVSEGDSLYFSDIDGYFYSYNTKDQKLNWEPIKPDSAITASPLAQSNNVLLPTESGNVYSIDPEGKVALWYDEPSNKGKAYTTPVSSDGHVLIAYLQADYFLIALNEDGHQAWTFPSQQ